MKIFATLSLVAVAVMSLSQPTNVSAAAPIVNSVTWHQNLYEGFQEATANRQPLVVLFTNLPLANATWTGKLDQTVLGSEQFDKLAGRAVFVRAESHIEDDKGNYAQLKRDLKIDKVPAMVVLDVTPERIIECGRIVGYFEPVTYVDHLNTLLSAWQSINPAPVADVTSR